MSVTRSEAPKVGRAEVAFREAFERLKKKRPNILGKGAAVSQNNVAKEAGLVPSALKKSRFPKLVAEIQQWIDEHGEAPAAAARQTVLAGRNVARGLRRQISDLKVQRDKALGLLAEADARILELTVENDRLKAVTGNGSVADLDSKRRSRSRS
jgi:hypothetical protein